MTLHAPMFSWQARAWQGFEEQRSAILSVFAESGDSGLARRYGLISGCCAGPMLFVDDDGVATMSMCACRDRMCPRCSAKKAWHTSRKIAELVESYDSPRFVTLTLKHRTGEALKVMLDRLALAFRTLRKTPVWKQLCKNGVWVIEVTRSASDSTWHAHLHVVADGRYVEQRELSREWLRVTGDSPIVDIRAVRGRRDAARYLGKYVGKGADLASWSDAEVIEYANAIARRRTFDTVGSRKKADPKLTTRYHRSRRRVACLISVVYYAQRGNEAAREIVTTLANHHPIASRMLGFARTQGPEPTADESLVALQKAGILLLSATWQGGPIPPMPEQQLVFSDAEGSWKGRPSRRAKKPRIT